MTNQINSVRRARLSMVGLCLSMLILAGALLPLARPNHRYNIISSFERGHASLSRPTIFNGLIALFFVANPPAALVVALEAWIPIDLPYGVRAWCALFSSVGASYFWWRWLG